MDTTELLPPPTQRPRRRHSRAFKEHVVAASFEPGNSVAGVAQQFHLNANLVHKWRRQSETVPRNTTDDFIPVALPVHITSSHADANGTLRVELASSLGAMTFHWPMAELARLATWLRSQS